MHHLVDLAWTWGTRAENRFMVFLLLCGLMAGVTIAATSIYDAWKADLPWMGWYLRRRQRARR